jgi:hypothetical protein
MLLDDKIRRFPYRPNLMIANNGLLRSVYLIFLKNNMSRFIVAFARQDDDDDVGADAMFD